MMSRLTIYCTIFYPLLDSSYQNSKYCPNLVQHLDTVEGKSKNRLSKNLKMGSSRSVSMEMFLASTVSAMALDKKLAIDVRMSASEDSINRLMIAGLFVTTLSNPAGYILSIPSIMLSRSLKEGDFSQKPNVSFWQMGRISLWRLFGFEMSIEKNFTKDAEERHFSKKWT